MRKRHDVFWAVVFLLPAIVSIIILRIYPTAQAFITSLYKGMPGGVLEPIFNGFGNYSQLLSNQAFIETLWRTIVFNIIVNPLQIVIALLLAQLLTRNIAARSIHRTLLFVPATIPIVGSTVIWGIAMRPQGPINGIIQALGGSAQPFIYSPQQSMASIMLIISWIGVGYWMIFLISGIENIPEEYYEAARLDRAGPIRTFLQITIPLLKRPLLFVLVADTVANFVLFVPIQMLTNGGPENSTTMLMFSAYRTTFAYSNRHLGATEVVILTLIMLTFVAIQFRLLREETASKGARK